jgi:hypothetical protein
MGTKRVGLARTEALIENLKREINWGTNSSFVNAPALKKAAGGAGQQGETLIIIGKNGAAGNVTVDPFQESSTQLFGFGTLLYYGDRIFRYTGIGGVAVTAGKLLQTSAAVPNHRDVAVQAAAAAGVTTITVTLGATAATANQYKDGYIHINDDAGQGQFMRIKSNPAADASATLTLTLYDKVVTALTTSSKADLIGALFNDVVVAPTAETGALVGVTAMDMTADYYGWVQVSGPCSVLTSGTLVLGHPAVRSDTLAGAVEPGDHGTAGENFTVGSVMVVNDDTDNSVINLNLL